MRTLEDAKDEHPELQAQIHVYDTKPATLKGLYRYLPKYVRIAFGSERFEQRTPRRRYMEYLSDLNTTMSDYAVSHTFHWTVPDAPTAKHIDDPNNPDED